MQSFRKFLENIFDDLFADLGKQTLVKKEEKSYPITIDLYRGFDADLDKIDQDMQYYFLSPRKSEQGQLWFTHKYINVYDPIEYAKNHGDWFMTYKLPVIKHVQVNHWDDGTTSESLPDWWTKKANPLSNSQFYAGLELPDGWVFSYKTEKFIGCQVAIKVPKNWIVPSSVM